MMKHKAILVAATLAIVCLAVPVSHSAAEPVFPVRPFSVMTVSAGGPVSAWNCGNWYGYDWTPDYFSAEWAPWDWPGWGPQSYMNWMLGGGWYDWYGWSNPYNWYGYYGGMYLWTGWYSLYRGFLPDPWMYRHRSRHGHPHSHPAPKPVVIRNENPRRGGSSADRVRHRRRPPVNTAPPVRVPRGRPRFSPRPMPMPMPSPMPSRGGHAGAAGRHRR